MKKLRILVLGSLVIAAGMLLLELEGCEPEGNKNTPGKSSAEVAPDKPTSSGGGSGSQQGDSGPSGDTSAGAPAEPEENIATVPGQPGQAVEAPGHHTLTSITIQWTPPASRGTDANGADIAPGALRYHVQYKVASSGDWTDAPNGTNIVGVPGPTDTMFHFEVANLQKETGYKFRVRAKHGAGPTYEGPWSDASALISTPSSQERKPGGTVDGLTSPAMTSSSITIRWAKPRGQDAGVDASGAAIDPSTLTYDVQYREETGVVAVWAHWTGAPNGTNTAGKQSGGAIEFMVTGLRPNTRYGFRVRIRNNNRNRNRNKGSWYGGFSIFTSNANAQ